MKFSVMIPAYKRTYLKECIDSILTQTYTDFELIIVNDASPEDLDSIVNSYSDSRIHYYKNEENCGAINVVDNWNICLSYAKGDYVICMGDDDKLLPNCLEEYAKLIETYPNIGLIHGWTEIINEESTPTLLTVHRCEYESALSLMWHRQYAYSCQFIGDFCFNREWLQAQGGFYKLPLAWGSDDISAIIGASKNGVANTQTIVFQYRVNSQTISSTGNMEYKLKAINQEYEWKKKFLNSPSNNHIDEQYRKQLLYDLIKNIAKKKSLTLAKDLCKSPLIRSIYWWMHKSTYKINNKVLISALIQAIKDKNNYGFNFYRRKHKPAFWARSCRR